MRQIETTVLLITVLFRMRIPQIVVAEEIIGICGFSVSSDMKTVP